ncbi:hypothetical protein C1N53_13305 [Pontibacter sp. SGAir0037]|nr:hypothetical protein C1N53_13305 [Pontibacter sp. SGAir0037]
MELMVHNSSEPYTYKYKECSGFISFKYNCLSRATNKPSIQRLRKGLRTSKRIETQETGGFSV